MKIDAGKLDRAIEVLIPATITDEYGQDIDTFNVVATIYGQRLEMRTQDTARAGTRDTFAMARYLIRYRANLDTGARIRTGGKLYDVVGIDEPDRRATLILTLEEATR